MISCEKITEQNNLKLNFVEVFVNEKMSHSHKPSQVSQVVLEVKSLHWWLVASYSHIFTLKIKLMSFMAKNFNDLC